MSQSIATTGNIQEMNNTNFLSYDPFDSDSNKRKNAIQPCVHCLKAQLTCDGSRPCQSCYKRGLANTCTDAARKKTKTQPVPEQTTVSTAPSSFLDSMTGPQNMDQFMDFAQLFNISLADLGFGSDTAGLEYGIIGNMLQNPLADLGTSDQAGGLPGASSSLSTTTVSNTTPAISQTSQPYINTSTQMPVTSAPTLSTFSFQTPTTTAAAAAAASNATTAPPTAATVQLANLLPMVPTNTNNLAQQQTSTTYRHQLQHQQPNGIAGAEKKHPSPAGVASTIMKRDSVSSSGSNHSARRKQANERTPEAVYNSVRKPFNYAEGFHYLIRYVKEKMGREDLMRISRALALFRPSFLALIMNLTEEDLVFMEKCFQRTLLEYEKLISFSGTPTVVWRRTGEICLVGKEFSLLTQWQRDVLLSKKTYIYELMDNGSAVEYWEKFSTHAFDNTDKACIYSCILRTPAQKAVPCTFCFTIKRDIFDLPSVIVGNFLPLLS